MAPPPESAPVLIIEDDPDLRRAGRAPPARSTPRPCLVLLDLMLPTMEGFEFRLRQLEDPALAAIPVIVFSGGGDVERKVARLGVAASLMKPLDFETLLEHVARCRLRN